jgi:hypothetical protein
MGNLKNSLAIIFFLGNQLKMEKKFKLLVSKSLKKKFCFTNLEEQFSKKHFLEPYFA